MIENWTMFETAKDLMQITGIATDDELYEAGFVTDDMDWGFVCDELYSKTFIDEYGCEETTTKFDTPYFAYCILSAMENHCVGYKHIQYKDHHYYITYHA